MKRKIQCRVELLASCAVFVIVPAANALAEELTQTGVVGSQLSRPNAAATQSASGAPPATADVQSADADSELMDVVVTARRRNERLIDVPVTVTALTEEAVARYATTQLSDLGTQVPQMSIDKGGAGSGANIQIRGVGSVANDSGVEQMVAVNVDGVIVSRARGIINAGLLDVGSVEVLKGPQALFFGKNSPGGVISINSVNPDGPVAGYLRSAYDFLDDQRAVEGAISLPLTETLSSRVAFRADDSLGYIRNAAQPLADPFRSGFNTAPAAKWGPGDKNVLGRLTLAYRPAEPLDATFKIYYDHFTDDGPAARNEIYRCPAGQTHPVLLGKIDPTGDCTGNYVRSVSHQLPPVAGEFPLAGGNYFSTVDTYLSSLTANYKVDAVTITSTSGYFRYDNQYDDSFDYTSLALLIGAAKERVETFSQELRAASAFDGPLNFIGGAYYEHLDRQQLQDVIIAPLPKDPVTGRYDTAEVLYKVRGNTYSVFGELNWKIMQGLELAGGARYTYETREGDLGNVYVNPFRVGQKPAGVRLIGDIHDDNVSPEATLTWHPRPNATLYTAYKTGFLSSGFSNPTNLSAAATIDSLTFQSVKAKGGEIGAKGSFLSGRLDLDATAYLYDYDGLQLTSFDPTTFTYTTKNAAAARVEGVELQGHFAATTEFALRGFIAYNHGRYQSFPNAQCYAGQTAAQGCVGGVQNLSGQRLGATPDVSAHLGATYDRPVTARWNGALNLDVNYSGEYNSSAGASNFRPDSIQRRFCVLDANLRLYSGAFDLAVIGRNLTDRKYIIVSADAPGSTPGTVYGRFNRPREFILQGTYRFGESHRTRER
jgi:iron complex outermembrane recepter protein